MNTGKILDIAPRWSPEWQPPQMRQSREGPPDAKPVEPVVAASHTTDLVRRHAEDEARLMGAAKAGREELERQFARDRERFEREHGGSGWQ